MIVDKGVWTFKMSEGYMESVRLYPISYPMWICWLYKQTAAAVYIYINKHFDMHSDITPIDKITIVIIVSRKR